MIFSVLFLLFGHAFFNTDSPTNNAKQLNDSAYYHYDRSNFDKAMALAARAKKAAIENNEPDELFRSYTLLASVEIRKGYLQKGLILQKQTLKIANDMNRRDLQAKTLSSMASTLSQLARYDSAELLLNQIIAMKEVDPALLISVYGRLGLNYKRQQNYDKAIANYLQSLTLSKGSGDSLSSARTLANIGNVYMEQNEAKRALEYYNNALQLLDTAKHSLSISGITVFISDAYQVLGDYDQAEKYLHESLRLIEKLNLPASKAYALESLGILYFERGHTAQAIVEFSRSLQLNRMLDNWSNLESVLINLAQCYLQTGELNEAQGALREAQALAHAHKHALGLKEVYKYLARLDSARGDFRSAFDHFKKSTALKDSLFTIEKTRALEEIGKKYEVLQKEEIIRKQQEEIRQERTKVLVILLGAGVLLISGGVIFLFYKRRQQLRKSVEEQQKEKQKLMDIVLAQEQTQQKIARDIHDSFLQILGAAKIGIESAHGDHTISYYQHKLYETAQVIDKACHEARTLTHQLLPYSLEKYGLLQAVEELLYKNPAKGGVKYTVEQNINHQRFTNTIEINCYRIIQELINNTVKHAEADEVKVSVFERNRALYITVGDDGNGFNTEGVAYGAGLLNIQSRLKSMNGSMHVESRPHSGTVVVAMIPLS